MTDNIIVLIPSYDRPEILEITLPQWLKLGCIDRVFLGAEALSQDILRKYEEIVKKYESTGKLTYLLILGRSGSVKVRNTLLDMAAKHRCKYVLMADDDYLLSNGNCIAIMIKDFKSNNSVGAVGGKVIGINRRRIDPDFFLNIPINLADPLTRLIGYIFLDTKHGPRYSEALPPFFMMRKELLDKMVRYDETFNTPTGFREESDFQWQIKQLGYRLLYDPRASIIHLAPKEGGNRPKIGLKKRIYWKARNHTYFINKWYSKRWVKLWYSLVCAILLTLYFPISLNRIMRGLKDGLKD